MKFAFALLFITIGAFSVIAEHVKNSDHRQKTVIKSLYNNTLHTDSNGMYLSCYNGPLSTKNAVKCYVGNEGSSQMYPVCRAVFIGGARSFADCTQQQYESLNEFGTTCVLNAAIGSIQACHCLSHHCNFAV